MRQKTIRCGKGKLIKAGKSINTGKVLLAVECWGRILAIHLTEHQWLKLRSAVDQMFEEMEDEN